MPTGAAITTAANMFAANQTINGNLILGEGGGVQFANGTLQTTAAAGASSGVPSGFMIMSTSPTPPAGYSSTYYQITTPGTAWSTSTVPVFGSNVYGFSDGLNVLMAGTGAGGNLLEQVTCPTFCLPLDPNNGFAHDITMPTTAYLTAAALINPSPYNDPKIYVIGGFDANGNGVSTNQIYDPRAQSWTTGASMPTPRSPGMVTVNGLIYAIGGATSVNAPTAAVEVYNPATDSWSTGVPLPAAPVAFAAVVVNGTIYVIEGDCSVYSFNPSTSTSWAPQPGIPSAAGCGGAAAADQSGNIFTVDTSGAGTVGVYATASGSWESLAPLPFKNVDVGVAWASGVLYAIQGTKHNTGTPTNQVQTFNTNGFTAPGTFYVFTKN
jgi:Kelch motif